MSASLWPFGLAALGGYLAGSVPFGLILTRLTGAGDLRGIGSGNIGATNVLRTGRKGLALATVLLDALKGALPALLGLHLVGSDAAVAAGGAAALGHCFPVWLGFKGGKAVATGAGVVFALTPVIGLCVLVLFVAVVAATRIASVASMSGAATAAVLAFLLGRHPFAELYLFLTLLIVVMHRANIRRLIAGNENRLTFRP